LDLQGMTAARLKERVIMKPGILGAAVMFALAAEPSMAGQPRPVAEPQPAISTYCATIEPGNPFSKVYDYQAWSAFRSRGTWDNRGSDACARNPLYSPPGTPAFKPNPYPNPSWF
jgi:hypothetical protein